jgi:hypothetical protein
MLCCLLAALPAGARDTLRAWLLPAVARAPLTFQPLLLACPPLQAAYRRCRPRSLLALHLALFGLQHWLMPPQRTDWLAANALLASHPAGLCLLACVWVLQMRFALQTPALLTSYAAHVLLLPLGWRHVDRVIGHLQPPTTVLSHACLWGACTVLTLLSAWWLVPARRLLAAA